MADDPPPTYAETSGGKRKHISQKSTTFEEVVADGKSELVAIREATVYGNEPFIRVSPEEINKLFNLALIGKFSQRKPSFNTIQQGINSLRLLGDFTIGDLDNKHIIINFENQEDYLRIFLEKIWYINRTPMRILKYTFDFNPNVESPIVPIWIALPKLPLVFYDKAILYSIASAIGNPLKLDEPTATKTCTHLARVCMEVDVTKPRVDRIRVGNEEFAIWQRILYEDIPDYCSLCKRFGHHVDKCYWKSTAGIDANNGTPLEKNKTGNESKSVKNETASTTESNAPSKGVSPLASSKTVSTTTPSGPVTEDEIRAVLLQKTPVTTYDIVLKFRSRLMSREDKDAFAAILRRIAKIRKTNEANYLVMRGR